MFFVFLFLSQFLKSTLLACEMSSYSIIIFFVILLVDYNIVFQYLLYVGTLIRFLKQLTQIMVVIVPILAEGI